MEDLVELHLKVDAAKQTLSSMRMDFIQQLRTGLWGPTARTTTVAEKTIIAASPKQLPKRAKRLTSLHEKSPEPEVPVAATASAPVLISEAIVNDENLMPPPTAPRTNKATAEADVATKEQSFVRPSRAAKLKIENKLKEPQLRQKLRRPVEVELDHVKKEHEQRASQALSLRIENSSNVCSEDSIEIVARPNDVIQIDSDDEPLPPKIENKKKSSSSGTVKLRELRVIVKREKSSFNENTTTEVELAQETLAVPGVKDGVKGAKETNESVMATTISSNASTTSGNTTASKKNRKKKVIPKPIKVERFSDEIPVVVERTTRRKRTNEMQQQQQNQQEHEKQKETQAQQQENEEKYEERAKSIYEDAQDNLTPTCSAADPNDFPAAVGPNKVNKTVVLGILPSDATFCTNPAQATFSVTPDNATFVMPNPNATVTLAKAIDATFSMPQPNKDDSSSTRQSMVTAKDTSPVQSEEEYFENKKSKPKVASVLKMPTSAKSYKMPTRTNELFNPVMESPVKKRIEAFENAAAVAANNEIKKSDRVKKLQKEGSTTPTIGILSAPVVGRFLTPTQSSSVTPNVVAQVKKAVSASKAMPVPKITAAGLKATQKNTLSRENSAEEMRKGMLQLQEERKKQREQKQLQAAQQREARERERAERVAKINKDREEKRLKKQMEAEKKKRELEDINRQLQKCGEAATEVAKQKMAKKKIATENEREILKQLKSSAPKMDKGMPPPPPLLQKHTTKTKYDFDMLHEEDSTDEEGKVTMKRPPAPEWSRSSVRGPAIVRQQPWPTSIIDKFFSVQPQIINLKEIFPTIDDRYLQRNSSVFWDASMSNASMLN